MTKRKQRKVFVIYEGKRNMEEKFNFSRKFVSLKIIIDSFILNYV